MFTVACDIAILPAADLAQKAITASEQLGQFGTLFTLKDGEYFPHISLYMAQLKTTDLDKAKALLAKIASDTALLDLKASRYRQSRGYIDVEYQRNTTLNDLQMTVVEAINPIRDGTHEENKIRMATATGKVLENFEKYGYPSVGELFRPHMTFTRFTDGQPKETNILPTLETFSGQSTRLGIFELGDNGTCVRKIAEFNLGGATS